MNEHEAHEFKWFESNSGIKGLRIFILEFDRTGRTGAGFYEVVDVSLDRGMKHTWGIEFKDWQEFHPFPNDYEKVVRAVFGD